MDRSEIEIIRRIQEGDRDAFEGLVTRFANRVYTLAFRMTGDREEAEDIRQLAFLRLYRSVGSFNGSARFSTWLYQVVMNLCRDRLRSKAAAERVQDEGTKRRLERPRTDPGPIEAFERQELSGLVASAIAALPAEEREVVLLRHYEGLLFSEIAEIVGAPATTVKSRMGRALERLRARLGRKVGP